MIPKTLLDIEIPAEFRPALFPLFPALVERFEIDGLKLTIEHDFGPLVRINRAAQDNASWDEILPPANPEHGEIDPDRAFWLRVADREGRTVATLAHRLFEVADLADELRTLRLFYPHTIPDGDRCEVKSRLIDQTRGRIVLGCAGWVADEWRGRKLFGPLVLAGKALSLCLWQPDWWFGLAEVDTLRRVRYGTIETDMEQGGRVTWWRGGIERFGMSLIRSGQLQISKDIACFKSYHFTS